MTQMHTSSPRLASNRGFKLFQVRFSSILVLFPLIFSVAHAQSSLTGTCQVSTQVPQLRAEGLTEVLGDIVLSCSGFASGAVTTGSFTIILPVSATNRIDANGFTSQASLSLDVGSGPAPVGGSASVTGKIVTFNGVTLTAPASGSFTVRISGIRAAVNQLGLAAQSVAVDLGTPLQLNQTHVTVGNLAPSLFVGLADTGIPCTGSPVPSTITVTNLFSAGTSRASSRVTEGFSAAFAARGNLEDSGTRFLISYRGFPAGAHLYLPDRVAGSDAAVPSLGGDLGGSATVGQYLPGSGTLLLARVFGADATGAGGTPLPLPAGNTPSLLDSVTEVTLTTGSGYAVYEVMDANANVVENAQFPTFVGLASGSAPSVAHETISLAPVSTVTSATSTDAVPRFASTTPGSDCNIVGDCQAPYFPKLNVPVSGGQIQVSAIAGGAMTSQPGYIPVQNVGGGTLVWTITVNYVSGSGWIQLEQPALLVNNGSVRVFVVSKNLAAGTYQANIVIDAGSPAGSQTIPVTLTVQSAPPPTPTPTPTPTPAPPTPTPTISQIVNAASFSPSPLVSGSVATLQGSHLSGKLVTVTVGGQPATILFMSDTQINFQVPAGIGSQGAANVVVTADGVSSPAVSAPLAPAYPAIFTHGIRNQDWSENTAESPAGGGTVLQIFATGIPSGATVTAQIGNQMNLAPQFAGAAPTVPGVQQVNVTVPGGIPAGSTQLVLCATVGGQPYCSTGYALAVD